LTSGPGIVYAPYDIAYLEVHMDNVFQHLKLEVGDFIATVTLDRPPVNALSMELYREITRVFNELSRRDDVRVAILTGAGRVFCAGRDIKCAEVDSISERLECAHDMVNAIYHCECPVIAAVNGPATGAGFATVTMCDIIIASESAFFRKAEIDAGVNPSIKHLTRALPEYKARMLGFTGEPMDAREAYRLGMVERVVPPDELLPTARKLAGVIAGKSPLILKLAKRSANEVEAMTNFLEAYVKEQAVTQELADTEDSREAGRSFIEKRAPKFKGR